MRKLASTVFVLALTACSVGRPTAEATGAQIYQQLCANCHGEDLAGGIAPPLGPGSVSASQPDEFLVVSIMEGRGRMPSFSASLDEQQLQRLIAYIRAEQSG
jgi:mono/diheme cytochrome c family protein